ncbi:MAG: lysozyme inhibitor LprI family protein [Acidobacteriota bacterium]
MKLLTSFALLVLTLGTTALAQDQKKDPCAEAQTQLEMNMCWGNQYKAADTQLNAVYREFASKLSPEETAQLKAAQLAWLKFRDANCEFVADIYKGGTIRPMMAGMCLAHVTSARTSELKAQMKEREDP